MGETEGVNGETEVGEDGRGGWWVETRRLSIVRGGKAWTTSGWCARDPPPELESGATSAPESRVDTPRHDWAPGKVLGAPSVKFTESGIFRTWYVHVQLRGIVPSVETRQDLGLTVVSSRMSSPTAHDPVHGAT